MTATTTELMLTSKYNFESLLTSDLEVNHIRRNALLMLEDAGLRQENAVDVLDRYPDLSVNGSRDTLIQAQAGEDSKHPDMLLNALLYMAHCAPASACRAALGKHTATSLLSKSYWKNVWWQTHPYMYRGIYILAALMCGAEHESTNINRLKITQPHASGRIMKIPYISCTGRIKRIEQEFYPTKWLNSLMKINLILFFNNINQNYRYN